MRPIKNWSVLVPAAGPKPVEQAREQVEALRAKIAVARERVEAAKLALAQAEQHDREQMSNAIRKNVEPKSEVAKVEKLRSARAEAERRAAATEMAVAASEADLAAAVDRHRENWLDDTEARAERAPDQARRNLAELGEALADLRAQRPPLTGCGPVTASTPGSRSERCRSGTLHPHALRRQTATRSPPLSSWPGLPG